MHKLVTNQTEAVRAIAKFQNEVSSRELQERLPLARSWYGHRAEDGTWVFAHSKFVGYEGLTANAYLKSSRELDGRKTEARLADWFTSVPAGCPLHDELFNALSDFLSRFGKHPSKLAHISVLKDEIDDAICGDLNTKIVELILAVATSLPSEHLRDLRTRLAA